MKIYAAFYKRIIETKIITQFYSMKKKEHHNKKKNFSLLINFPATQLKICHMSCFTFIYNTT